MQPGLFCQVTHAGFYVPSEILYQAGKGAPPAAPEPPGTPLWEPVPPPAQQSSLLVFVPLWLDQAVYKSILKQAAAAARCPARQRCRGELDAGLRSWGAVATRVGGQRQLPFSPGSDPAAQRRRRRLRRDGFHLWDGGELQPRGFPT